MTAIISLAYILFMRGKRKSQIAVIILAGGLGKRMGCSLPKQFCNIKNKPIINYSIELFLGITEFEVGQLIIVVPNKWLGYAKNLISRHFGRNEKINTIEGGKTRILSYFSAIKFLDARFPDTKLVIFHDAARPMINKGMVIKTYNLIKGADMGLLAGPIEESLYSIKSFKNRGVAPLDREKFFLGQTPHIFKFKVLKEIYKRFNGKIKNVPASADIFFLGSKFKKYKIKAVKNEELNIKITHPHDLRVIKDFF